MLLWKMLPGLKHTYDARFGAICIKTLIPLRHNLLMTPMTLFSKTFWPVLNVFFTTSCQAELTTHKLRLAVMTVLWLLSPMPETSLQDSCLKTCIRVYVNFFPKNYFTLILYTVAFCQLCIKDMMMMMMMDTLNSQMEVKSVKKSSAVIGRWRVMVQFGPMPAVNMHTAYCLWQCV